MKTLSLFLLGLLLATTSINAQTDDPVVKAILNEANDNSQLKMLGHELMDVIGPRLVGTPQMKNAHDWAVDQFEGWGVDARNEAWGQWRGWERGITHIDMVHPRIQSLRGTQLAWNPTRESRSGRREFPLLRPPA